jgi:bacillopeptidase F
MSRLENHQNKQIYQRIIISIVLFIAFIIFFFTSGIKLLVSFTLFLNQLANSGTKQQTTQQTETLNTVTIDPIPSATNSSSLTFSGTALNFDKLVIYLNDEKQDEMSISDSFTGTVNGLEKGTNTVYFIAKSSKSKETKKSETFDVLYKNDKPKLEISEPNDGSKTNKEDIRISGKTDKETTIRINGQPLIVDVDGKFTTLFRLKDGENKIQITAEDIVGNQEKKDLTVTYSKDE